MNWKPLLRSCILSCFVALPYNMIGCSGGDPDPYDYFVSFFHKDLSVNKAFEPFYYTNYQFLYQSEEPVNTAEVTSAEWINYTVGNCTSKEAYQFICRFDGSAINRVAAVIRKQSSALPDSLKINKLVAYLIKQNDEPAISYLSYAKRIEPLVTASWNSWDAPEKDTTKMRKLIDEGIRSWKQTPNEFLKLRYAYQVTRLALYSDHPKECIRYYDEMMAPNKTVSVLQDLGAGLKAGALFRTGKKQEAAYTFSKLFSKNDFKKIANYMSFDWCVKRLNATNRQLSLSLCKNNSEKANMLGLYALGSNQNELPALNTIYGWAPQSSMIRVLLTREIQKLEEFYFTPSLSFAAGNKSAVIGYSDIDTNDPLYKAWKQAGIAMVQFCQKAALSAGDNKGLFLLAGAHAATLTQMDSAAQALLDQAKPLGLSDLEKDQWAMTNLLLTINSKKTIDSSFEQSLLPSLQWMEKKAATDVEFAKFYRRLFVDLLASKYKSTHKSSDYVKFIVCNKAADDIQTKYIKEGYGYYPHTSQLLHNEVTAVQAEELIRFIGDTNNSSFEKFLLRQSGFNKNDLYDIAGTTWLRQYNLTNAEKWFRKIPASYYQEEPYKTYLAANPFADLLLDTHTPTSQDTIKYTKLQFTQRMIALEKKANSDPNREVKAKAYYELAKGYYQMSYWGNSWLLVQYGWGSNETEYLDQTLSKAIVNKDYYQVKKAREYYLKALAQTLDNNFQARCIFMVAKCDQKALGGPPDFNDETGGKRTKAYRDWLLTLDQKSTAFSLLQKNFSSTPFYKEAFNTCSYLKDFVLKR